MSHFLADWLIVSSVVLAAIISPGPDFVITVRNALVHSRSSGLWTAVGIGLGIWVHVAYCILGISALLSASESFFEAIKYCGAAYLVYIGIKALRSPGYREAGEPGTGHGLPPADLTALKSLRGGFLTNVLNPKATLFFFALFSQVVDPGTPVKTQLIYGATASLLSTLWFGGVAVFLTDPRIKAGFLRFSKLADRITGGLLIALGIKLALQKI